MDMLVVDSPVEAPRPMDAAHDAPHPPSGHASVELSATSIDYSLVPCGAPSAPSQSLTVTNKGTAPLAVAAKTLGADFGVSPSALTVPPGMNGTLVLSAAIPATAMAGTPVTGSLVLFTNDPTKSSITVPLSAKPAGAHVTFAPMSARSFSFSGAPVGSLAGPATVTLLNDGNAPANITLGNLTAPFSLESATTNTMSAGDTWAINAGFTAPDTSPAAATLSITFNSPTCGGTNLSSLSLSGQGATGKLAFPSAVDFGPADCGGSAPAPQSFLVINTGGADARVTTVSFSGASGFATDATVGQIIAANGGSATIHVTAPAVPANSAITPIGGSLSIQTDADTSPHTITLSVQPRGALLTFNPTNPLNFGPVALLKSATQSFNVVNAGTGAATVALTVLPGATADGGVDEAAVASPFTLQSPTLALAAAAPGSTQSQLETVTFWPQAASPVTSSVALTVTEGALCGPLPAPLAVLGSGLGGGPTIGPTPVNFPATCGAPTLNTQSFLVANNGTADFTWSMSLGPGVQLPPSADAGADAADATVDGAGSAEAGAPPIFTISADPPPGLLIPGAASTVTVTGTPIPSPAPSLDPGAYSALVTITTDVPLDPPHVVTLSETLIGDQLSFSLASPMRFGQIPIDTSIQQQFTVTNAASAGSPPANVALVVGGLGATGYAIAPASIASLAPGATSGTETVTFSPAAAASFPATLAIQTTDAVCAPLPSPIQLSGTGTNGVVAVSAATLTFGTDPHDSAGLVDCASTGLTQTVTVSNKGNQAFNITSLSLGKGNSSPFNAPTASTMNLGIGATSPPSTITITPKQIPATVANPSDTTLFADTLTIATDVTGDTPHVVNLVMQARGAVISNVSIATTWPFGTISYGSVGTITSTIQNTGNAPAAMTFTGLAQPTIFALQGEPTPVPGNGPSGAYTEITGEFIPPSPNGYWSDHGTLVLTAPDGFCGSPPAGWSVATPDGGAAGPQEAWTGPTIQVSGTSNSSPPVTLAGTLAFPAASCGDPVPAAQSVTLTNQTNVAYRYVLSFSSGKYYTSNPSVDAGAGDAGAVGSGTLPANGTATILVQPDTIVPSAGDGGPGSGVVPGSAPYADTLLIAIESPGADAGTPPIASFTVPISWTLNGAVFTLPPGYTLTDGTGHAYYPADENTGFSLPMSNKGTASASVDFSVHPQGMFTFSPSSPFQVTSGIGIAPLLYSTSSAVPCSAADAGAEAGPPAVTEVTATFVYTGSVCQPFPQPSVTIGACWGTFP
jgi:hypothetical protein